MVIFDRIGRLRLQLHKQLIREKACANWRSPLGQANRNTQPSSGTREIFRKSKCLSSKERTSPTWHSNTNLHFHHCNSWLEEYSEKKYLSDIGLWMSSMTQSHGHAMKWKKDFFHCHPAPASLWRTVPWSWRWCKDSGQEAALDYPNPSSSSEIEKVVSCGCLHRRRAWNSPTAPQKSPNSALLNKKHLHGIGDAFLMHCDDKKAIRHFSGLFFGL